MKSAPTTYVDWHATSTFEGLEVHVASIEEKRDTDGHEVLRVWLRLRLDGKEHDVHFSGLDADSPSETWNGYKIEFRGGSKQAVGIAVTRLP